MKSTRDSLSFQTIKIFTVTQTHSYTQYTLEKICLLTKQIKTWTLTLIVLGGRGDITPRNAKFRTKVPVFAQE